MKDLPKTYYETAITKTVYYSMIDSQQTQIEPRNTTRHMVSWFFNKDTKALQWQKIFSTSDARTTGYLYSAKQTNKVRPYITSYTKININGLEKKM